MRNAGFNERHKHAFERCGRYLRLASNFVVGHVKLALELAARDNGAAVVDFDVQTEWEVMLGVLGARRLMVHERI